MNRLALAAIVAVALPVCANATTIDFNSAEQNTVFGPTYSESGYTLTGSNFVFPQFEGFAFTTYGNDGSLTLNYKGPTYTLTKDGGGAFDFTSFDLGNVNGNTNGGTLQVSLDGGAATTFAIPTDSTLATFTLGATDVTSVAFSFLPGEDFSSLNSYARLDNLVVSSVTAAVPEPATWAMMIGGIGFAGGVTRRRYRKSEDAFTAKVRGVALQA